jgi:serine phosphatase RsbU (regulator of sigma subunit)
VPLGRDETLILYTDGVTDVAGPLRGDGASLGFERFGPERLRMLLTGAAGGSPEELLGVLEAELAAFQEGGQADDTAVLALRPTG